MTVDNLVYYYMHVQQNMEDYGYKIQLLIFCVSRSASADSL